MIDYSILLVNNNRSKAYLQNLIINGFIPKKALVLNDNSIGLPEHTENDKIISKDSNQKFIRTLKDLDISFDEKEHILSTIEKNGIDYVVVDTLDVNSVVVISEISKMETKYIVYSGPGGTILRKNILSQGKKFVHVHPGLLPQYRGSTTIYYSMLINFEVGASIILFEEGIDEGPVLYKKNYKIEEKGIDFDYALDPLVRAKTLVDFFKKDKIDLIEQEKNKITNTFYIVHPFIKHASIIKYNNK